MCPQSDDRINRAIALMEYAEHNAHFTDEPMVRAAMNKPEAQRDAVDMLLLSTASWQDGEYEKALRWAYMGIAQSPEDPRLKAALEVRLGTLFHDLGSEDRSWELAEQCYNQAAEHDAQSQLPYIFLGDLRFDLEEFDEAEEAYLQALRLAPDDPSVHNSLGFLYQERGQLDRAEAAFKRAAELEPTIPIVHLHLATLYQETNRPDAAIAEYERAIAKDPGNPTWYHNLADLLRAVGRTEEAQAVLQRCTARPTDGAAAPDDAND